MTNEQAAEKILIGVIIIITLILTTLFFSWRISTVVKHNISLSIKSHMQTDVVPVIRETIHGNLTNFDNKIKGAVKDQVKEERIGSSLHIVQKHETLSSISKMYHTTVEELIRLNPEVLSNPDLIYPGLALKLPK